MNELTLDLFGETQAYDAAGAAVCQDLGSDARRQQGITLTPKWLVDLMLHRVAQQGAFDNIVDAGAGSGRFCIRAARLFPLARIWAVERSLAHAVQRTQPAAALDRPVGGAPRGAGVP